LYLDFFLNVCSLKLNFGEIYFISGLIFLFSRSEEQQKKK
jgi:hypothetical protein